MKYNKPDIEQLSNSKELLEKIEGGVSGGTSLLGAHSTFPCEFHHCVIMMYGTPIEPGLIGELDHLLKRK